MKDPIEKSKGLMLETDVLAESLLLGSDITIKDFLLLKPCYTTVIQVTELLEISESHTEQETISKCYVGMRILGIHPRYSETIAKHLVVLKKIAPNVALRCAITATISQESSLPIITNRFYAVYSRLENVVTIKPSDIR
ncbi:MAG: hypothetical protein K1X91_09845 [Bacteriodetes bacterium]|nr:hypothetical protein [Bacteroidota bacterium]